MIILPAETTVDWCRKTIKMATFQDVKLEIMNPPESPDEFTNETWDVHCIVIQDGSESVDLVERVPAHVRHKIVIAFRRPIPLGRAYCYDKLGIQDTQFVRSANLHVQLVYRAAQYAESTLEKNRSMVAR